MKKIYLLIILATNFIFSQNDYATIHIYRPKMMYGSMVSDHIHINGLKICELKSGGHLEYKVFTEMNFTISVYGTALGTESDKLTQLTLNAQKGNQYYFKIFPKFGRIGIEQISEPISNGDLKEKNYISLNDAGFTENNVIYNHPKTEWNKDKLIEHWKKNGISEIEGIFEKVGTVLEYELALIKEKNEYFLIYLDGANGTSWKTGDVKAVLQKTASFGIFKAKWYMLNKTQNKDIIINFKNNSTMSIIPENGKDDDIYFKTYPTYDTETNANIENPQKWKSSGTGFFIDKKGYLATNFHVIKEAKTIEIVYNGKPFKAKVEVSDEQNDLAILKIDDNSFVPLTTLNYNFKTESSEVGTSVFALGFPMTQIMGEEIKFTDGKINAKSGYKGEISTYQISVPIQPGNSGGPLFDNDGNLVGITSSGLDKSLTDNVNYAIKTKYLNLLIEEINDKIELPKTVLSKTTLLTEKIKSLSNYVVYIKVK